MAVKPFTLSRRAGPEVVATYAHLAAGDVGYALEPGNLAGAPGAKPDALFDLTVSFHGNFGSAPAYVARLAGSNDGRNWFAVEGRHVDGSKFKFFRPEIDQDAGPVSIGCEIHATNRPGSAERRARQAA